MDEVAKNILEYLVEVYHSAKRPNQQEVNDIKIVRHVVKDGITREQVIASLRYLDDNRWVLHRQERNGGFTQTKYRISPKGVDYLDETPSQFKKNTMPLINIQNTNGIVVIGDNNYVQSVYQDGYTKLDALKVAISKNDVVDDEKKIQYIADIETIQKQLVKKEPLKEVIRASWGTLQSLATIEGLIEFYKHAEPFIHKLLS